MQSARTSGATCAAAHRARSSSGGGSGRRRPCGCAPRPAPRRPGPPAGSRTARRRRRAPRGRGRRSGAGASGRWGRGRWAPSADPRTYAVGVGCCAHDGRMKSAPLALAGLVVALTAGCSADTASSGRPRAGHDARATRTGRSRWRRSTGSTSPGRWPSCRTATCCSPSATARCTCVTPTPASGSRSRARPRWSTRARAGSATCCRARRTPRTGWSTSAGPRPATGESAPPWAAAASRPTATAEPSRTSRSSGARPRRSTARATSATGWRSRPTASTSSSPPVTGSSGTPAQDTTNTLGSIVRLTIDGEPAPGNPMADEGGVTARDLELGPPQPARSRVRARRDVVVLGDGARGRRRAQPRRGRRQLRLAGGVQRQRLRRRRDPRPRRGGRVRRPGEVVDAEHLPGQPADLLRRDVRGLAGRRLPRRALRRGAGARRPRRTSAPRDAEVYDLGRADPGGRAGARRGDLAARGRGCRAAAAADAGEVEARCGTARLASPTPAPSRRTCAGAAAEPGSWGSRSQPR